MRRSVSQWQDRIAGRLGCHQAEAEAVIRRAYRAGALPEPQKILWAAGPREVAQVLAFVEAPPRRLRRSALAAFVVGAGFWIGLALMVDSVHGQPSITAAATLSLIAASLNVSLAAGRDLPPPPDKPALRRDESLMSAGATGVFITLAVSVFALQMVGGLPSDWLERGLVLAGAAATGGLPGVFLGLRIRHAYDHLPPLLRKLAPPTSVARQLERARAGAWNTVKQAIPGPRLDSSLLDVYSNAHWEAFAQRRGGLLNAHDRADAPRVLSPGFPGQVRLGPPRILQHDLGDLPLHLDGLEDAAQAAVSQICPRGAAAAFADLAFHVDRLYPFATIAVAVRPPTTVALDTAGRPHAEGGPALAWADGTCVHAWRGREVPSDAVDRSQPVTLSRIDREADPQRRWVLIERYGLGLYLQKRGAVEVHIDGCGQLYRLDQPPHEPIVAVRVRNHTPEPDGTVREFWLRVPPTMVTAREAVAWTFGLSAEAYEPLAQS